jgi:catechol-2,3-dioxygenase
MRIRFVYTALQVKDLTRSAKFYTEVLGMKTIDRKRVKETNGEMCWLGSGRNVLELNSYEGATTRRGANLDHLAFEVSPFSSLPSLSKDLQGRGIKIHERLATEKWERFFIEDPDGNWIEVFSRK